MSLSAIKGKVTSNIGRQVLVTQKNSPTLLFFAGAIGFGVTVVLASRATLKMDEILREGEEKKAKIVEAQEKTSGYSDEIYTEEDAKKDGILVKTQTAVKISKLYAPAVAVGLVSIGALTGSHIILSRRNVAVTAAYAAMDKGFKEYRGRVVEAYGKEKDQEFRYGVVEREIAVETDEGVAVKTVKDLDRSGSGSGSSIYAKLFARETSDNWQEISSYNQMFIQAQQNYANDLLQSRGHVFLNEIYDMLGLERTKAGAVVGWVKGHGDDYISFGVFNGDAYMGQQFVNGNEKSVWLDFNVDGLIYDLL